VQRGGGAHERGFIHRDLNPRTSSSSTAVAPSRCSTSASPSRSCGLTPPSPAERQRRRSRTRGNRRLRLAEQLMATAGRVLGPLGAHGRGLRILTAAHPFPIESREAWRQLVLSGRFRRLSEHLATRPRRGSLLRQGVRRRSGLPPRSAAEFFQQLGRRWAEHGPLAGTQSPDGPVSGRFPHKRSRATPQSASCRRSGSMRQPSRSASPDRAKEACSGSNRGFGSRRKRGG